MTWKLKSKRMKKMAKIIGVHFFVGTICLVEARDDDNNLNQLRLNQPFNAINEAVEFQ